ncbi:glycosyltransferase family 2 protein [Candidatus Dependentiae bacterium]
MSNQTNLDISVVLGSYNRFKFLKLTIDSIRNELNNFSHEIIVIDGGSNDGSLEWLIKQKDIITFAQPNHGEWLGQKIERRSWGYFMNLGFKCAQGKYICLISDDCLFVPGSIKNAYDLAEKNISEGQNIGGVAFYFRSWSDEEKYRINYTLGRKLYINYGLFLNDAIKEVNYIDEDNYFFYHADEDLSLRIWEKGYKIICSPNSFVEHYMHANLDAIKSNHKNRISDYNNFLKKWTIYKKIRGYKEEKEYKDEFFTGSKFRNIDKKIYFKEAKQIAKKLIGPVFIKKIKQLLQK